MKVTIRDLNGTRTLFGVESLTPLRGPQDRIRLVGRDDEQALPGLINWADVVSIESEETA